MAKKKQVTTDTKGFDTFNLISGDTFNPVAQEAAETAFWEEESKKIRENIREPVWHDILKLMCNQKIKNKENLSYDKVTNFTKDTAFFMILQGYAHINPILANVLNQKEISPHHAMDVIYKHIRKTNPRPQWDFMNKFYPLMKKDKKGIDIINKEGKKVNIEITENDIKEYCKEHRISLREFEDELTISKELGIDAEKYLAEWIYYKKEIESGGQTIKIAKKNKSSYDDDSDQTDIPDNVTHPTVLISEQLATMWDNKLGRKRESHQKVSVAAQPQIQPQSQTQQQYVQSVPQQQLAPVQTPQIQEPVIVHSPEPVTEPITKEEIKRTHKKMPLFVPPEEPKEYIKYAKYNEADSQKDFMMPKLVDGKMLAYVPTDLHILENLD